jgi:uncharacterized protein
VPNFQKGRFGEGIFQGAALMVHKIAEENGVKITGMPTMAQLRKKASGRQNPFFSLLLMLVLLPFFISYLFNRRRHSSHWGGPPIIFGGPGGLGSGGFGGFGSFGGGGGGSFGGGGASGRW